MVLDIIRLRFLNFANLNQDSNVICIPKRRSKYSEKLSCTKLSPGTEIRLNENLIFLITKLFVRTM
jgi:hypothetical protein